MDNSNRNSPNRKYNHVFRLWGILASVCIVLLILTVSTYAWFSSNRIVSTNRAETRSGTDTLELQISSSGGAEFHGSRESSITQVNNTSLLELMPVSTSDLRSFVYNPVTIEDVASSFLAVENEEYYYHGRFYIRASAQGHSPDARVALYFDEDQEAGGGLAQAESGMFLNAARLGLTFDNENPSIFYLSDSQNETNQQIKNTELNNNILEGAQVLHMENGVLEAVADPSIPLSNHRIVMEENRILLPEKALMELELNRIYTVDVYLYLEGCDLDCSDSISLNEANIHLSFYGILEE